MILMTRPTLRAKGQLTLPDDIRKAAHLESGDPLEAEITPDGIRLRPQKVIDATQVWFWTPEWQSGERGADQMPSVADLKPSSPATSSSMRSVLGHTIPSGLRTDRISADARTPERTPGWRGSPPTSIRCPLAARPHSWVPYLSSSISTVMVADGERSREAPGKIGGSPRKIGMP